MNINNVNFINFGNRYYNLDDTLAEENEKDNFVNDTFRDDELLRPDEDENYRYFEYSSDDLPLSSSITTALRSKVLPFDYAPQSVINANKSFDDEQKMQPYFRYCKLRRSDGFYKPSHPLFDIATRLFENEYHWGEREKEIMTDLKRYDEKTEKQYISRSLLRHVSHMLYIGATNKEILNAIKDLHKSKYDTIRKIDNKYKDTEFDNNFDRYCEKYKNEFDPSDTDDGESYLY